jgi:hypothetical protein
MSSLWAKVEEEFQLCLKVLDSNVIMLKNHDLPVTIEHVKNDIVQVWELTCKNRS